ncbi:MAG: alpha/beta fold hydrolase [Planktotalea sp.]|uniref:alpha/beta hydrolase family protein n=1 Tax=Planktotalea sp. TaxID=2029877 RepID=UPI003C78657A
MKHFAHMLALTLSIGTAHAVSAETYAPGIKDIAIQDGNSRALDAILWYPASIDAPLTRQHRNGVWVGVDAAENAAPVEGTYPLVVLSHGMYGNARNQNWLAVELVKKGYIVASLNHPGTSTWLRDADDARQIWERPKDVSRAISYLLNDTTLKAKVDPDHIYMAGHSLGGMTGAQLAGARYDPEQMDTLCSDNPSELICEITSTWNIGAAQEDRAALSQDLSDQRIKAIALLDLGATQTFSSESLGAIKTPLLVIGGPKDVKGSLDLDKESRALVAQLSEGVARYLEPATLAHFDMLGLCTEKAIAILEDEAPGDGMVCADGTEERIKDHAIVADAVISFFNEH